MNPFEQAVRNKNPNQLKLLIDLGYDLNAKNKEGENLLHVALVHKASNEVLQILFESGVDIDEKDMYGRTPIFKSVAKNAFDSTVTLLKFGASVNDVNEDGQTPIFVVNTFEMLNFLFEHGADVNATDHEGRTAIFENFALMLLNLVSSLIEKGADINIKDINGQTPLIYLANHTFIGFKNNPAEDTIASLLINGAKINQRDNEGNTALYYAIERENIEIIKLLLEYRADLKLLPNEMQDYLYSIQNLL